MAKPTGRPSDYSPEYCEQMIEFMANGRSYTAFAASLGTYRSRLDEWAKANPDFQDAKKAAFAQCQAWWEQQGQVGLFNDKNGPTLNSAIWIFNMKSRFKDDYTEVQKIEHSGHSAPESAESIKESKEIVSEVRDILQEWKK